MIIFRKFPENFLDFPNSSWYFSEFSQNISRNFSWKLWNQFSFVAMLKNNIFFYLWNCLRKKCDILSIELSKERKYVKTFFIVKWITGKIKDWSDIKIILFLLLKLLFCKFFFIKTNKHTEQQTQVCCALKKTENTLRTWIKFNSSWEKITTTKNSSLKFCHKKKTFRSQNDYASQIYLFQTWKKNSLKTLLVQNRKHSEDKVQ